MELDLDHLLDTAIHAARAGGAELNRLFRHAELDVRFKRANDLVTEADHASEEKVLGILRDAFPDHRILAEESGEGGGDGVVEWLVDPLDGTTNYAHGIPAWVVSIGARRGTELLVGVVYDPSRDDLFAARRGGGATWNGKPMRVSSHEGLDGAFLATGYPFRHRSALDRYIAMLREVLLRARGVRRFGAAALDLAWTAAGLYDGFFELRLSPWDIAAGALLIEEAGGVVSNLDGDADIFRFGNIIAGAPSVQSELRRVCHQEADENLIETLDPRPAPTA
ncbi:MAG: inositol monophosphatase family protein [Acidobacteriota bacterium]